jgi:DNA topoisomerase-1
MKTYTDNEPGAYAWALPQVFKNVSDFRARDRSGKAKKPDSDLFDCFDAGDLNKELRDCMEGLTVKVRRSHPAIHHSMRS